MSGPKSARRLAGSGGRGRRRKGPYRGRRRRCRSAGPGDTDAPLGLVDPGFDRVTRRRRDLHGSALSGRIVGSGPHPAVVMGHGIGAIKAGAWRRSPSDSVTSASWRSPSTTATSAAPAHSRANHSPFAASARTTARSSAGPPNSPYIDPRQVITWGMSFAGMHVLELAVADTRLVTAVAQAPLTDGLAAARMSDPKVGFNSSGRPCSTPPAHCSAASRSTSPATQNPETCPTGPRRTDRSGRSSCPRRTGHHGTTASPPARCSASPGAVPCDAPPPCGSPLLLVVLETDSIAPSRRPARPRSRPQGTRGRTVPRRRRPRRSTAHRGRLPPPSHHDRSPEEVLRPSRTGFGNHPDLPAAPETPKAPERSGAFDLCVLGRIRTCNLLIRSSTEIGH